MSGVSDTGNVLGCDEERVRFLTRGLGEFWRLMII